MTTESTEFWSAFANVRDKILLSALTKKRDTAERALESARELAASTILSDEDRIEVECRLLESEFIFSMALDQPSRPMIEKLANINDSVYFSAERKQEFLRYGLKELLRFTG